MTTVSRIVGKNCSWYERTQILLFSFPNELDLLSKGDDVIPDQNRIAKESDILYMRIVVQNIDEGRQELEETYIRDCPGPNDGYSGLDYLTGRNRV